MYNFVRSACFVYLFSLLPSRDPVETSQLIEVSSGISFHPRSQILTDLADLNAHSPSVVSASLPCPSGGSRGNTATKNVRCISAVTL